MSEKAFSKIHLERTPQATGREGSPASQGQHRRGVHLQAQSPRCVGAGHPGSRCRDEICTVRTGTLLHRSRIGQAVEMTRGNRAWKSHTARLPHSHRLDYDGYVSKQETLSCDIDCFHRTAMPGRDRCQREIGATLRCFASRCRKSTFTRMPVNAISMPSQYQANPLGSVPEM